MTHFASRKVVRLCTATIFKTNGFYVIRGEFIVQVEATAPLGLHPGDSAFAPRKVPHAFAKINDGDGQMLVLFQPAGNMEDFFKQMSKLREGNPEEPKRSS